MIAKTGSWPRLGRTVLLVFFVFSRPSLAKASHNDKPGEPKVGPVRQIHATWVNEIVLTADTAHHGALLPGLAGRLYLLGPDLGTFVKGNGKVVVELFDDSQPNPKAPARIRWEFNRESLDRLFRQDTIGWGYTLFLPWPQYRGQNAHLLLKVHYELDGLFLSAPPARIVLKLDAAFAATRALEEGETASSHGSLPNRKQGQKVVLDVVVAAVDTYQDEVLGVEIGLQSPMLFQPSIIPHAGQAGSIRYSPVLAPGPGVVAFQGITNLGSSRGPAKDPDCGGHVSDRGTAEVLVRTLRARGPLEVFGQYKRITSDNEAVLLAVRYSEGSGSGKAVTNLCGPPIGVVVQVTPKVTVDGYIVMLVESELPDLAKEMKFSVKDVNATVNADDGATVMLAGETKQNAVLTETRLPFLGDLPGLGCLFRWRTTTRYTTRVLVFVTPHIVRDREDAEGFSGDENNQQPSRPLRARLSGIEAPPPKSQQEETEGIPAQR